MADRGMTPSEFGLRVRKPSGGTGDHRRQQDAQWHADDRLVFRRYQRDHLVRPSPRCQSEKPRDGTDRFVASLGSPERPQTGNRIWREVSGEDVAELLTDIKCPSGFAKGPWRLSREIHPVPEPRRGTGELDRRLGLQPRR